MKIKPWAILAGLALAPAIGCDKVPADAVESCQAEIHVLSQKTDVLVVVDDSSSTSDDQENLRQNLDDFVTALAASPVAVDLQIGVTTTDVYDYDGTSAAYARSFYAYPTPYPQGALVAVDAAALTDASLAGKLVYDPTSGFGGARILSGSSPTLVDDFQANVLLGSGGSSKEQPFRAAELALRSAEGGVGVNQGFLRSGARLGVILLTDEDDCSEPDGATAITGASQNLCQDEAVKPGLMPPADFAAFLRGELAGEARDPVVAVIAGFDPDTLLPTGCSTSSQTNLPTRLAALLDVLGSERSFRGSICDASFGPSLQRIAQLLIPQTVSLDGAPSDAHMLAVRLTRRDGATVACTVAGAGEAEAAQADAVYTPPQAGSAPTLTFQNGCTLQSGDSIDLRIVCAG